MKTSLTVILIFLFVNSFCQNIGIQYIENPSRRIKSVNYYDCKSFDLPDKINNSTTDLKMRIEYSYQDSMLTTIKTQYFNAKNGLENRLDSIVYISSDSVIINRLTDSQSITFSKRLYELDTVIKFLSLPKNINPNREYKNDSFIIKISNDTLKTIEYSLNGIQSLSRFAYNNSGLISRIMTFQSGRIEGDSWVSFRYLKSNEIEINSGSKNIWHTTDIYKFDNEGYILKEIQESDTNPTITMYEYENGKGNSSRFTFMTIGFASFYPIIY